MSYCRWSEDSQVYVYESCSGGWDIFTTDNDYYNELSPRACADRLESLREAGYVVPQYAIDALREEQSEPGSD